MINDLLVGLSVSALLVIGGVCIFGPRPLELLQDKVKVGDCIASKMPDFGSPQKMYSDKYFRVTSKGRDGVVVDILITEDYGKTYTLAGERHLYWTDINLTYTVYPCP